jgi:hypothetical protein
MSEHRTLRAPGDAGAAVVVERLHHDGVGGPDADPLADAEHPVLAVALAGQPDAAGEHGQFAGAAADAAGLAGEKALAECVQGRQGRGFGVRVHHQSPQCMDASSARISRRSNEIAEPH